MSEEKIKSEVIKSLENEENYKKYVPGILSHITSGNKLKMLSIYLFNIL